MNTIMAGYEVKIKFFNVKDATATVWLGPDCVGCLHSKEGELLELDGDFYAMWLHSCHGTRGVFFFPQGRNKGNLNVTSDIDIEFSHTVVRGEKADLSETQIKEFFHGQDSDVVDEELLYWDTQEKPWTVVVVFSHNTGERCPIHHCDTVDLPNRKGLIYHESTGD